MIIGINEKFPVVYNIYLPKDGRFLTAIRDHPQRPRLPAGVRDRRDALPPPEPPRAPIRIGPESFTVVGVLNKRGQMFGQSRDNFVGIPITTLRRLSLRPGIDRDRGRAAGSRARLQETIEQISASSASARKVAFGQPNDFAVFTQDTMLDLYNQITGAAYLVMIVISSIGLLVGGIGVMNIMLVAAKERTREIGIRKALGARRRDILRQFLIEAMVLTGTGGVLGTLVGFGVALLVRAATPLPASVTVLVGLPGPGRLDLGRPLLRDLPRPQSRPGRSDRLAPLRVVAPGLPHGSLGHQSRRCPPQGGTPHRYVRRWDNPSAGEFFRSAQRAIRSGPADAISLPVI